MKNILMKVLVTGGAGFIGSHLVDLLVEKNYDIKVLVREGEVHPKYNDDNNPEILEYVKSLGVEIVYGNLLDKNSLLKACRDVDMVYHLAAIAHEYAGLPRNVYFDVNVKGTKNMLDACLENNIEKFIYVSTIEATGPSTDGKPVTEETKPKPVCVYGMSKLGGEVLALYYGKKYGMDVRVARPPMTYGDRSPHLSRFFRTVKKGIFPIFGSGETLFEFCYVGNQAYGIYLVAEKGKPGEIYFISEESYKIREVVEKAGEVMGVDLKIITIPKPIGYTIGLSCEILAKIFPFPPFRVRETGRPYVSRRTVWWTTADRYICSIEKAKRELGYKPIYTLEEGLRRTIAWYMERGIV